MAKPGAQFDADITLIKTKLAEYENRITTLENNVQVPNPVIEPDSIEATTEGDTTVLINANVTSSVTPPEPAATRPYGDNAPWNVPVSGITRNTNEAAEIDILIARPNGIDNWNLRQGQYTYPVYHTSDATGNYIVNAINSESGLNGSTIPFNPTWAAAPGTDAQMIILNTSTGEEYNIWKYTGITGGDTINASRINRVQGNDQGSGTGYANYFTREVGYKPSRGMGVQYLMGLVRPWEIDAGVIEHALSMPSPNISNDLAVAPATKIEGIQDNGPVKEGMRFSLEVTDGEIDTHLATLPGDVSTTMKASLKIVFQAMRDYGWFITDNAGAIGLQLENDQSADWASVGMVDFTSSNGKIYPRDALDGLVTQGRLRCYEDSNDATYPAYTADQAASFTNPDLDLLDTPTTEPPSPVFITDDFNRADQPLTNSASWTALYEGSEMNVVSGKVQAGGVVGGGTGTYAAAHVDTRTADQYAQIEYSDYVGGTGGENVRIGVVCRATVGGSTFNGYSAWWRHEAGPTQPTVWTIVLNTHTDVSPFGAQLAQYNVSDTEPEVGDAIRLKCVGTTISVEVDEGAGYVERISVTNSDHSSGSAGIYGRPEDYPKYMTGDNWEAGDT